MERQRRGNGSIQEEIQAFNNQAQAANRPKVRHGKNATRQTKPLQNSYHRRTSPSSDKPPNSLKGNFICLIILIILWIIRIGTYIVRNCRRFHLRIILLTILITKTSHLYPNCFTILIILRIIRIGSLIFRNSRRMNFYNIFSTTLISKTRHLYSNCFIILIILRFVLIGILISRIGILIIRNVRLQSVSVIP